MKARIAIRFDDVCPQMDMGRFERMVALVESYGVKGLLGIVTDNTDPDLLKMQDNPQFWQRMKELERSGWILGMHGVHHALNCTGNAILTRRKDTEFASVPFRKQRELIREGKEILQRNGVETNVFFAPAHSYDRNTLRALKAEDFQYVSDGRSRHTYRQCGMVCIPCRVYGLPGNPKGEVTIALHTNNTDDEKFEIIERFLNKYRDCLVDYSELLSSEPQNYVIQKVDEKIYMLYFYNRNWIDRIRKGIRLWVK